MVWGLVSTYGGGWLWLTLCSCPRTGGRAGAWGGAGGGGLTPVSLAVQEEELVALLARHCCVQLGASVQSEAVRELLPGCIPSKLYRTKSPEQWASLVTAAHAKVSSAESGLSVGGAGPGCGGAEASPQASSPGMGALPGSPAPARPCSAPFPSTGCPRLPPRPQVAS